MLVLASASERRRDLLTAAGIPFEIQVSNLHEPPPQGEAAEEYAKQLAREKARTVRAERSKDWILGADTVVLVDGQILGKPADYEDAVRILRLLSGRTHYVTTGICLLGPTGECACVEDIRSATTSVTMMDLTEDEIRAYVATGESMDKAGAFAIQGMASRWVTYIEGDYFNVVGLPVSLVYRMLREHGVL
ncbi:MAG: septum formation protein Maf [Acidobacteriales bacterium]|nr:septum formation protein Maf [Terriglobales bacterium]